MSDSSNVSVRSNVMLDDVEHKHMYRFLPGDFAAQVYPECRDVRSFERLLTKTQLIEKQQYLICMLCKRPCAGTCRSTQLK